MYSYFIKFKLNGDVYSGFFELDNVLCESNSYTILDRAIEIADKEDLGHYKLDILDISYLGKCDE